jgi:aminoglycoside phosphotransferase family enzyme/predicted kinase
MAAPDDPQGPVVAFLSDPATHRLDGGTVKHIRTHISDLFLAGDFAYKLKRAVHYAFVDFRSLEARKTACEAEISLNRRTAPEIYLRAAAIRKNSDGSLAIDGASEPAPGEAIEWIVVMRRFDETMTLDHVADASALTPEHIDAVIDAAVLFHAGSLPVSAGFGGAEGLSRVIGENSRDMATLPATFDAATRDELTSACRAALARHAALLDRRRRDGYVRRCHGDMHLGNIVLVDGRPLLFDCIEFSDAIATIDVGYDIAFLLMDLLARNQPALANRALGRYVGRTGDTGFLGPLGLMMAMRALVRAKVSAMEMKGASAPVGRALLARVARLIDLARTLLAPAPPPRLIAVGGLSGTGKTTLAAAIAPTIGRPPGALHLRSDILRKRIAGIVPEQRLSAPAYRAEANIVVYDALNRDVQAALEAGSSVVVDAVFARPNERKCIEEIARVAGVPFSGFWLKAPEAVMMKRVATRRGDASDATTDVVANQLTYDAGDIGWRQIDADAPPAEVLRRTLAQL